MPDSKDTRRITAPGRRSGSIALRPKATITPPEVTE
jgi:hypothetical protein